MTLTKSQIKNKINSLTREKQGYESEKNNYRNSLTYANKLLNDLNISSNYLINSNDNMRKYFTINNKTGDNGKINEINEDIKQIIKKLNNTIIPNINSSINNLTSRINNLNTQINRLWREYSNAEE